MIVLVYSIKNKQLLDNKPKYVKFGKTCHDMIEPRVFATAVVKPNHRTQRTFITLLFLDLYLRNSLIEPVVS